MRKKWETPRMMIQEFAPNEYVAACYIFNAQRSLAEAAGNERICKIAV